MTESTPQSGDIGPKFEDVYTRRAHGAPLLVAMYGVPGGGVSAGHRDALPPGVFLQGSEGAERAVELQGRQVPVQDRGPREGMVQEAPVRGEQDRRNN